MQFQARNPLAESGRELINAQRPVSNTSGVARVELALRHPS
jgi:hypothetical protein